MVWGHKVIAPDGMEGMTKQMSSRIPRQVLGGIWLGQGLRMTALKLGGRVVKWARGPIVFPIFPSQSNPLIFLSFGLLDHTSSLERKQGQRCEKRSWTVKPQTDVKYWYCLSALLSLLALAILCMQVHASGAGSQLLCLPTRAGHSFCDDLEPGSCAVAIRHILALSGTAGDTTLVVFIPAIHWNYSNTCADSCMLLGPSLSPTRT